MRPARFATALSIACALALPASAQSLRIGLA